MNWLRARLAEPSTYGGLAGICLVACFMTFTIWADWMVFGYAAGGLFVLQAVMAERRGGV